MWVEQGGRTPLPQAAFRASAVSRLGSGGDLLLDLPANATGLVSCAGALCVSCATCLVLCCAVLGPITSASGGIPIWPSWLGHTRPLLLCGTVPVFPPWPPAHTGCLLRKRGRPIARPLTLLRGGPAHTSGGLVSPAALRPQVAALAQSVEDVVAAGFVVRARADADTLEARAAFTGRRDAMIVAGPQVGGGVAPRRVPCTPAALPVRLPAPAHSPGIPALCSHVPPTRVAGCRDRLSGARQPAARPGQHRPALQHGLQCDPARGSGRSLRARLQQRPSCRGRARPDGICWPA